MQPYFLPYGGYFQLFAAADLVVIYDCVQFPRRGWVHRNQLRDQSGDKRWLTLPLEKTPLSTRICDLRFKPDTPAIILQRGSSMPAFASPTEAANGIAAACKDVDPAASVVSYLETTLHATLKTLGLSTELLRSSSLSLPDALTGEARILAICQAVGANRYINASGGRSLYHFEAFTQLGVELTFLAPYDGPRLSILQDLQDRGLHQVLQSVSQFRLLSIGSTSTVVV